LLECPTEGKSDRVDRKREKKEQWVGIKTMMLQEPKRGMGPVSPVPLVNKDLDCVLSGVFGIPPVKPPTPFISSSLSLPPEMPF
jgi:hypothetical protein